MSTHLRRALDELTTRISSLAAFVEEGVQKAVTSVVERDGDLARSVVDFDPSIDAMEVDVEEECLKILALHQPVANDLRFLVTVLKVNNDLERIGDLAANIAGQGAFLAGEEPLAVPYDLSGMASKVQRMLRMSLDALTGTDVGLARAVREADDEVDAIDREMYSDIRRAIAGNPDRMEALIRFQRVSQALERIADLATNIAEDVIYMVEGEIIRHTTE